jgi:hypothetical protein
MLFYFDACVLYIILGVIDIILRLGLSLIYNTRLENSQVVRCCLEPLELMVSH